MRVLPTFLVILGVAMVGAGAASATGIPPAWKVNALEEGHVRGGVLALRDAHRQGLRRAMKAPVLLGVKRRKLEKIAECESHGDPRAVSSDGTYRGKYQFSYSTWASVGGKGDPARAGELEQDQRAAMLYKSSGSAPWPVCG